MDNPYRPLKSCGKVWMTQKNKTGFPHFLQRFLESLRTFLQEGSQKKKKEKTPNNTGIPDVIDTDAIPFDNSAQT